jgi:hypothetical protein
VWVGGARCPDNADESERAGRTTWSRSGKRRATVGIRSAVRALALSLLLSVPCNVLDNFIALAIKYIVQTSYQL